MTIGGCLKEIDRHFDLSIEEMSAIGINLIQEIKTYFDDEGYPRDGWMLIYEMKDIYLIHDGIKHKVDLKPQVKLQRKRQAAIDSYSCANVSPRVLEFNRTFS